MERPVAERISPDKAAGPRSSVPAPRTAPAPLAAILQRLGRSIVRARDEPDLLEEQCRILVAGGFNEALVVMRESRGGGVHVAAHAGEPRVQRILEGPAASTVRHMVARVVRDRTPEVARRDAARLGAGASPPNEALAVIPLAMGGAVDGALILHALHPGAFTPPELQQLSEHCVDLGHGIGALREKARLERLTTRLKAAEERYAGIFENAREGIFAATRGGRLKLVNPAFARLAGYSSPSELLASDGSDLARLLSHEDHARLLETLETGATDPPMEVHLRQRTGDTIWVSLNAQVVSTFDATWIEGFVQDLTPLRAEREQALRLAAIVESTNVAILMKSLDGVIRSWNRGAEALFGFTAEEAVGQLAADLIVPPDLLEEEQYLLDKARAGEQIPLIETKRQRKDRTIVDVAISTSPIFSATGELVGVSVTEHDVTDRKQQEATRRSLERHRAEVRKLEEVDRLRTEFINEAAHELKTPLTPIVTHLQLIQDRSDLDEDLQRSISVIARNAKRMHALLRDMLDVSRLEAGRPQLECRSTRVCQVARDAVESFTHVAHREGISLEVDSEGPIYAEIDRARITQVLYNLIDNALKFTGAGGIVRVKVREEERHVIVSVKDEGPGLDRDRLRQLFRPFAMLHDPSKGPPGTGLGLFICKTIVEQHGGTIWAESDGEGEGLTVRFMLPKQAPAEEPPRSPVMPT